MTREQRQDVINLIGDIKETNLIDAGHDMLSALKHVNIFLLQSGEQNADTQDILDETQAAISKAEGRI